MSAKNIINGRRPWGLEAGGDSSAEAGTYQHFTLTEPWINDHDEYELFTIEVFRQGDLVTMVMHQVLLDMQDVSNWRRASAIPAGWRPVNYAATTFPACTNINSTLGRHEYDTDTLCVAEVGPAGHVILHRQPPPASGTWNRPDDTSRVGWQSFSLSWIAADWD